MTTSVFSHLVRTRWSHESENVATDALAFILGNSIGAHDAMTRVLRGFVDDVSDLQFVTQRAEASSRPDMWGLQGARPRVLFEHKFWAGLTENQPVEYLRTLAGHCGGDGALVIVVPHARQSTIWRELLRRLDDASVSFEEVAAPPAVARMVTTGLGPKMVLLTWGQLLEALQLGVAHEPHRLADIQQLRALCHAADLDAHAPLAAEVVSSQVLPAIIVQLSAIVQSTVQLGVERGVIDLRGVRPQASWERIGQYVNFPIAGRVGAWLGVDFRLWKDHGFSPIWLVFSSTEWGRGRIVRDVLGPWAGARGLPGMFTERSDFVLGLRVGFGLEVPQLSETLVRQLSDIAVALQGLPPRVVELEDVGEPSVLPASNSISD